MPGSTNKSKESRSVGEVTVSREDLQALVIDARDRTFKLVHDLSDGQFQVPLLRTVNPFLWEIGHVAYFQEYWVLRHAHGRAPILPESDSWYDSAKIAHDIRSHLPLPSRNATIEYLLKTRDDVLGFIANSQPEERDV